MTDIAVIRSVNGHVPPRPGLVDPFLDTTDPERLRVAIDVLTELVDEIELDSAVTSAVPGVDIPRIAGIRAVRAMAVRRRQCALARLEDLRPTSQPRRPVVLDPAICAAPVGLSRQGQPLVPVLTTGAVATFGLSSAQVWMPPGHTSLPHTHHHTEVAVVVLQGRAITLWWDEDGELHELPQTAGQQLFIPPGVPHAAINPHPVPVVAAEFRTNPMFHADNHLLPYLDPQVVARATIDLV